MKTEEEIKSKIVEIISIADDDLRDVSLALSMLVWVLE